MPQHTVAQGDCMMSIAEEYGFLWQTLWNHPDNAELKRIRKDPNILFPGDIVAIPEKNRREEEAPTGKRSEFVKKIGRAQVRLRLLDTKRRPRPNVRFLAVVDGEASSGSSDGDGFITISVRLNARHLHLRVEQGSRIEEYNLSLGAIDPIAELSGVQQRLANLGYPCGSEQETMGELTREAIRAFQKERNLEVTGQLDDATRQQLGALHGS